MQVAKDYDALGQVTRKEESAESGGIGRITDKRYDRGGRLTRLTAYTDDPGAAGTITPHTDYAYNKAGVKTRAIYPDDSSLAGC